jgi:hypothetical protein
MGLTARITFKRGYAIGWRIVTHKVTIHQGPHVELYGTRVPFICGIRTTFYAQCCIYSVLVSPIPFITLCVWDCT